MPEPVTPPAAQTLMCACAHHWGVHRASGRTAPVAACWGYIGNATPGPLREPCNCAGFEPWTGPTDSRTGEPIRPLTMATDGRVTPPAVPAEATAAAEPCEHYWAYHCFDGLSVRLCQLCHEPDWDSVRADRAEIAAQAAAAERELLTEAEDALHSVAMRLLTVSPAFKTPYADRPDQSPWSIFIGPQARRAHDLAQAIRRHLGLPFRSATRALGTPPLELDHVIAEAVTAERERIRNLAIEREATYVHHAESKPAAYPPATYITTTQRPFADLLGGDPE